MLLPIIVLVLCFIFKEPAVLGHVFPNSISETYFYYSTVTPFMIILGSSGILLMCYRGYTWVDDLINTLTGIAALGICLFPTCVWINDGKDGLVGTFRTPIAVSSTIHNISAIIFFLLLSYNVLFLFTKSSGEMTRNKKIRNIIYYVCGGGMLAALCAMVPVVIFNIWAGTWWIEAIALMFFGIAFLTKADIYPWLFCDTPYKD